MKVKELLLEKRKKLLTYVLATGIGITTLSGCENKPEYTINQNGCIQIEGDIDYDFLKDCEFMILNFQDEKQAIYITYSSIDIDFLHRSEPVSDLLTGQILFSDFNSLEKDLSKLGITSYEMCSVNKYLLENQKQKSFYTKEDLTSYLNDFTNKYNQNSQNNSKKLVKE